LSGSTKTGVFAKSFPERFFNMGVAEQDLMGTAAGLACMGKIAFASTFAIFATGRAWEIVRQSIAYPHLNVKIAASHAGLTVGEDGASHQALEDITLMRALPGMTVIVPADSTETRAAVRAAAALDGPCYIRLSRAKSRVIFDEPHDFKIGKAQLLREGHDIALVACGIMVPEALEAAERLAEAGVRAAVVNMPCIKPLDAEFLSQLARSCRAIVTLEEHSIIGGLGSAVCEHLSAVSPMPVYRIGMRDEFGQSGSAQELLAHYRLTAPHITEDVHNFFRSFSFSGSPSDSGKSA
jgi:transketolase